MRVSLSKVFILIAVVIVCPVSIQAQVKDQCSPEFYWDGAKCVLCVRPCDTGLPGVCSSGVFDCRAEKQICEPTVRPGERMEVCNKEDDDCDGEIDEGFDKDKDGYTTCGGDCDDKNPVIHPDAVEKCDGIDNDCSGVVDDNFGIGSSCVVGEGGCAQKGKKYCSKDGNSVMCDAIAGKPKAEICDGVDNDCDGVVDNGLGEITCGVGSCKQVIPICVDGKLNVCVPAKPDQEICGNHLDDDCNGVIDDVTGLAKPCDNGQVGECRKEGTTICDAKKGEIICSAPKVEPKVEQCDGLDNDCDGEIDEGVKNACGVCGELAAQVGASCTVSDQDSCSTGIWECDKIKLGALVCAPRFDLSEGKACDDLDACTEGDHCIKGACRGGSMPACEDDNSCTLDRCESPHGCIHEPIGGGFKNECGGCEMLEAEVKEPCVLTNLSGVCAKGEYQCTPEKDIACLQTVFAKGEICNGLDDDCDGLVDEEQGQTTCGIGACQVTTSNCKDGTVQSCQPLQPSRETCENMGSDDDCNGVIDDVNCGKEKGNEILARVFDAKKTRAAMLPWLEAYSSIATSGDVKSSWLLVSGKNASDSGIIAIPVKDIFGKGEIAFRTCPISVGGPVNLAMTSGDDLFASLGKEYYRFRKASSQIASQGACNLVGEAVFSDTTRQWPLKTCTIEKIVSLASVAKDTVAGAVICALSDSTKKEKFGLGIDVIELTPDSTSGHFIPLWESGSSIDSVAPFEFDSQGFEVEAVVDGKMASAFCQNKNGAWGCEKRPYVSSKPMTEEDILPQSVIDDVSATGKLSFANPHAKTSFNGKDYGGQDLFAAFDIAENARRIGTMGFFYFNQNEPPQGTISDVKFDGQKGVAKFNFTDPTGDQLFYKAHIIAKHGGSLDDWIEEIKEDEVRFSTKGSASAGVWPIKLVVEAQDKGGAKLTSTAIIANDGTIESIQDVLE